MSTSTAITGFRHAETHVGDTPQAIALRELGDVDRWRDLVQINGLVPPYLTDQFALAAPGVLLAGQQTIKVPSAAPPASGVADFDTVFGTDISLRKGRLEATAGGDLATISGTANLSQALENRLVTHKGDLAYYPDYGNDVWKLVGRGGTATADRLAASMVARAVRSDPRVSRVENPRGSIVGDTIQATMTAVAVDGKRVPTGLPNGSGALPTLPI